MQAPVEINVDLIDAAPTARFVAPGVVMVLAESIKAIGLLQPVSVRAKGERYELIVGGHRLGAARVLEWQTIPAFIRTDDDLHAELALIDENLIRNELSPAERAMAVARRKKIYQALHPETAHGAAPKPKTKSRQVGDISPKPERFTKATAKATGGSERGVQRDAHRGENLSADTLAKATGTSLDSGEQLDALAKLQPARAAELVERAAAGEKVNAVAAVKAEKRDDKERALGAKTVALGTQKYNVFYVDCPWRFEPYSRETGMDRAPENHYPTMTLEALLDLPMQEIVADPSVIFFWATAPMLMEALYVLEAWGFLTFRPRGEDGKLARDETGKLVPFNPYANYVSQQIWGKDRIGTGYWFRNKHEILIVCTRGDIPAPIMGTQAESLIVAAVKDHSRKPLVFRAMIERLFPNLPKLEMFARTPAPGWGQWGKEAPEPQAEIEEGLDGAEITTLTKTEKRDAALLEAAYAEVDAALDIPAFLHRPQPQRGAA